MNQQNRFIWSNPSPNRPLDPLALLKPGLINPYLESILLSNQQTARPFINLADQNMMNNLMNTYSQCSNNYIYLLGLTQNNSQSKENANPDNLEQIKETNPEELVKKEDLGQEQDVKQENSISEASDISSIDTIPLGKNDPIPKKCNSSKKIKRLNLCSHPEKEHYAKSLCYNCYHKYGRLKKPWKCSHEPLYARGLCQVCYIRQYYKKRKRFGTRSRKAVRKGRKAQLAKVLAQARRLEEGQNKEPSEDVNIGVNTLPKK